MKRVALVGCGRISKRHIEALKATPGIEIAYVCDKKEERAKAAAEVTGAKYVTDYRDLNGKGLDVVSVLTPSGLHPRHVCNIAEETDIPVIICEKPLSLTLREAYEVFRRVEKAGKRLLPVYQNRYNPLVKMTCDLIQSGKLGKIYQFVCNILWNRNDDYINRIHSNTFVFTHFEGIHSGDKIKINFIGIDDSLTLKFPEMHIGNRSAVEKYVTGMEAITIASILLTISFLAVLLVVIIVNKKKEMMDRRFLAFGLFLLNGTFWIFTDSPLHIFYDFPIEITMIMSYFGLILLPIGLLYFIRWSFKKRKLPALGINIGLCWLNVILNCFLLLINKIPLSSTIFATIDRALMGISLIVAMYYTLKFHFEDRKNKQSLILFVDVSVLFVCTVISVILYYTYSTWSYRYVVTIAMMLFSLGLIILLLYNAKHVINTKEELIKEGEIYRQLSYVDELTNIGNNRAFDRDLAKIKFSQDELMTSYLVVIDVNNTKRINDTYGHGAGNEVLKQCAECMQKSFGTYGTCYRIGGDEFASIITSNGIDMEELIDGFNDFIRLTNGDRIYKLNVATGYSSTDDKTIDSAKDFKYKADISMYKDKSVKRSREDEEGIENWSKMIDSIVSIFEVKDKYTAQHSNRVSFLAKFIAEKMELTPVVINEIFVAGKIHDIGKVGISDAVLTKEGKLTDEEFEEIKKHPAIGEKIILSSGGMNKIAKIVRHHHERFNGKGYPDGLSKDDIPLESRVLAIADSIDAMTSKRCYRKALSFEVCKQEIEKNLEVMYDPIIGKIVLSNWDEMMNLVSELKSQLEDEIKD